MQYPPNCETTPDKLEYLYSRQEALRLYHNEMGAIVKKWRDVGITKDDYDLLAKSIRDALPYKEKITPDEFIQLWIGDSPNTGVFYGGHFAEANGLMTAEIPAIRKQYLVEIHPQVIDEDEKADLCSAFKSSTKDSIRWTHDVEDK